MNTFSRIITIIFFSTAWINLNAAIFTIGSAEVYKSPNDLYQAHQANDLIRDFDTINIEAGDYFGQNVLAVWNNNNLLIRGVNGMATLFAEGQYIIGKGIFVSAGDNITFENIVFHDSAVPDLNGAGIRLDGSGLTVRNCLFSNNENGILANNSENGEVLIEYSEFLQGGAGDGFSHNIYINHCAKLTIQYCYFHSAEVGHQVKSRATNNIIRYNRIADNDGNSSRLIDLPNGGRSIIIGNELIQGPNAENNNLIGYGLEGLSNPGPHELFVVNNTILNYRQASCIFFDVVQGADKFEVINNVLGGECTVYKQKEALETSNLSNSDISYFSFTDEINGDYKLESVSPCINAGTLVMNDSLLIASDEYEFPLSKIDRIKDDNIDVGAHEFLLASSSTQIAYSKEVKIFPNPFAEEIFFTEDISNSSYYIFDTFGKSIASGTVPLQMIKTGELNSGIYYLVVKNKKLMQTFKIVKI